MNLPLYFAHGGVDETVEKSLPHLIFGRWYVAVGLLVLLLLVVIRITLFVSHGSKTAAYAATLATLFVAGVGTYSLSVVVSVIALSLGFALSLLHMILSLSQEEDTNDKGVPKA